MPLAPPVHQPGVDFVRRLASYGGADALVLADRTLSYADLARQVEAAAARLGDGRRLVLIAATNRADTLIDYLGALHAGHVVLLAPAERPACIQALLDTYDPDIVARQVGDAWVTEHRHAQPAHVLHPELALLLTTSGSTGSPKVVRLSSDNVQANAEAVALSLGITAQDRALTTLPFSHSYGLSVVHSHLLRGAAVVLTDLSVVDTCLWDLARSSRATSFAGVPYTFDLLDRVGFAQLSLPHLRQVTQAGGRLPPAQVRGYAELGQRQGWDLRVMYGQTEATARMACLPPALAATYPSSVGPAVPGGSFRLADERDGVGELVYTGPNVMLGYAESASDLRLGRTVAELRTGDLARKGPHGWYDVVGRVGRFAKVFGQRIDLTHLELALSDAGHACVCLEDDGGVQVVLEADADAAVQVRHRASELCGLPAHIVRVTPVPALPRLPSGKPDMPSLLAGLARHEPAPAALEPSSDLRALYAAVLNRSDVTEDRSFADLGGDSLSYVEMSVRLEQALGHLPADWHRRSIADLSRLPEARPGGRRGRRVETSVALRALAILLIVGTHADVFDLSGGSHVLLAVAGFNLARFCLGAADRVARLRQLGASVARLALPGLAVIAPAAALSADYGLSNVLLGNGFVGSSTWSSAWHFWFLEALVWSVVGVGALLAIPALDRAERRWRFGFPLALVGLGLLARYGLLGSAHDANSIHTVAGVLWLFALGWAAARARGPWHRGLLTLILLAALPGYVTDPRRAVFIAAGIALLVWLPSVPSTAALSRAAGVLASSSLYVYLTHWFVYPRWEDSAPLLAVAASLAVGLAYWQIAVRAPGVLRRAMTGITRPSPSERRSDLVRLP